MKITTKHHNNTAAHCPLLKKHMMHFNHLAEDDGVKGPEIYPFGSPEQFSKQFPGMDTYEPQSVDLEGKHKVMCMF